MSDAVGQVFEQLHELENIDVQAFMREIENETLMAALKDSTGKTVEKFLANMSSRARSMFIEEMEMASVLPNRVTFAIFSTLATFSPSTPSPPKF